MATKRHKTERPSNKYFGTVSPPFVSFVLFVANHILWILVRQAGVVQ
jgi:hypothetical protein